MDINQLRPHIQSRIAHEFGLIFLDSLDITIRNKLSEKDGFIKGAFDTPEIAKQESPKIESGLLMDALNSTAKIYGHSTYVQETNPKGYYFIQMTTSSCHVVIMRRESNNTKNAKFYIEQSLSNTGLMIDSQADLLVNTLVNKELKLEDHLFVCVTSYWNSELELLDLNFIVPHPLSKRPIFEFSFSELKDSASKPMTDEAEQPILALKKKLGQADDEGDTASSE